MQSRKGIIQTLASSGWREDEAHSVANLAADISTGVAKIPEHLLATEPRMTFKVQRPPSADSEASC
mgnify:CR=1 FL=1